MTLSIEEIEDLVFGALISSGASADAARQVAASIAAAEAEGVHSHGLPYVLVYCEHLRCGKVDGAVIPTLNVARPGFITVDAGTGFAHPAIALGFTELIPNARTQGIAALAIKNSYNCGVLGFHTQRLAREGLIGIGFTHAPASIAPYGGHRAVVGTNPIAIAVPGRDGSIAMSIDQSASVVAKSEIINAKAEGRSIPLGVALDPDGRVTTDPEKALKGTMVASGGYKGVAIALLVETLASVASGALLSMDASPFSGSVGGPPRTGQFFIAIDPAAATTVFHDQFERLASAISGQEGAHVPGTGRATKLEHAKRQGVIVRTDIVERIRNLGI